MVVLIKPHHDQWCGEVEAESLSEWTGLNCVGQKLPNNCQSLKLQQCWRHVANSLMKFVGIALASQSWRDGIWKKLASFEIARWNLFTWGRAREVDIYFVLEAVRHARLQMRSVFLSGGSLGRGPGTSADRHAGAISHLPRHLTPRTSLLRLDKLSHALAGSESGPEPMWTCSWTPAIRFVPRFTFSCHNKQPRRIEEEPDQTFKVSQLWVTMHADLQCMQIRHLVDEACMLEMARCKLFPFCLSLLFLLGHGTCRWKCPPRHFLSALQKCQPLSVSVYMATPGWLWER